MDPCAELTLHVACFLQAEPETPCSAARWALVPGRGEATFAEVAERLAGLEKPLVVGALDHPGHLAVWRTSALDPEERRHVAHTLANQQAALAVMLGHLGLGDAALVRFEGWGTSVDVGVPTLRRWLGEYALTWGWTVGAPTDESHEARLRVLQGGRRWSPGGVCRWPRDAAR